MVQLSIKQGALIISDSSGTIFEWNHRAFFNFSLNLSFDDENLRYVLTNKDEITDAVREVVSYLIEEGITFSADKNVDELVGNIQNQDTEFKEARANAKKKINVTTPEAFQRELKSYQLDGLGHLLKVGNGANFSVPGSGKTSVVYAYYDCLKRDGIVDKIFVVGPYSSFLPWEDEAQKCFGRKFSAARLVGSKRYTQYLNSNRFELFLCAYQTATNDKNELIQLCLKHKILLVLDESHYIKNFAQGKRANALLHVAPYAARRVVLSGTPMPNGYEDLWSQMTFLWPGKQLLGEKGNYRSRVENSRQHAGIKSDIKPFFHRVKKDDLKLPKPNFIVSKYNLTPIQAQIYEILSTRLLADIVSAPHDRQKLRLWRKAKMVRLLQAASNPTLMNKYSEEFEVPPLAPEGTSIVELIEKYSQFEVPAKFSAAVDLTKALVGQGKKVILWTVFVHNIKMLQNSLSDVRQFSIHGAVPRDEKEDEYHNREKEIKMFKTPGEPSVLIANPAACAESISLHKICHDAIYLDRTFNCGQYIQSLDRIHRIGLDRNETVNYHILLAANTIDETIDRRLDEKFQTMKRVLEDEIPLGGLDVEAHEMEQTDSEFEQDFDATLIDLRKFHGKRGNRKTVQ